MVSIHDHCAEAVSIFFFNHATATEIYTLSLHDALPISMDREHQERLFKNIVDAVLAVVHGSFVVAVRSEEHTSELQSRLHLVCRLLLEKKKVLDALLLNENSTAPLSAPYVRHTHGARQL